MTPQVEHVAYCIREALHKYKADQDGSYAVYVAEVAIRAHNETINGVLLAPATVEDDSDWEHLL